MLLLEGEEIGGQLGPYTSNHGPSTDSSNTINPTEINPLTTIYYRSVTVEDG